MNETAEAMMEALADHFRLKTVHGVGATGIDWEVMDLGSPKETAKNTSLKVVWESEKYSRIDEDLVTVGGYVSLKDAVRGLYEFATARGINHRINNDTLADIVEFDLIDLLIQQTGGPRK